MLLREETRNHSSPIDDDDSTENNATSPCQDSCNLSLRDTDYTEEYGDEDNDDDKGDYDVRRNEERSKEVNCESTRTTGVTVQPSQSERIVLTSCNRTSTTHSVSTSRNLDESSPSSAAAFRVREKEPKEKKEPNSQAALSTFSKTTSNSRKRQEQRVPNTKTQHIYPVTLNPFGDDDEEEEEENQNDMVSRGKITKSGRIGVGGTLANKQQRYPSDLNPFGDEDDGDEKSDERQSGKHHEAGGHQGPTSSITNGRTSATRGRRRSSSKYDESLNPFASEDEEEDEQSLTSTTSTPIPKPRSSLANVSIRSGKSTISAPDVISGQTSGNVPFRKSTSSFMTTSLNRKSLHLRPSVPPPPAPTVLDSQGRPLTPSAIKKKKAAPAPPPAQQRPVSPPSFVISGERDCNSLLSVSTTIATSTPSIPGTPDSSRSSIARKMSLTPSEATTCGGGDSDSIRTGDNASHEGVPVVKGRTSGPSRKKRPAPEPPKAVRRTVVGSIEEIESDLSSLGDRLSEIQSRLVTIEESLTSKNANNLSSSSSLTGANEEEQFDHLIYEYLSLSKETCVIARRQEELMYQRREHKLEQEHADLEFGIRALQLIPPFKKTPEEEVKEVELIQRLVDVVDQRNDVVENMTKINKR